MKDVYEFLNRAVKIGDKEGEITKILGWEFFEVTYFNLNDGKTIIAMGDVDKYLIEY